MRRAPSATPAGPRARRARRRSRTAPGVSSSSCARSTVSTWRGSRTARSSHCDIIYFFHRGAGRATWTAAQCNTITFAPRAVPPAAHILAEQTRFGGMVFYSSHMTHSHPPHPHHHHDPDHAHPSAGVAASLLRLSAARRLAGAAVLITLLWGAVFWAIA